MERKQANHHANQCNPTSVAHKLATDNRATQKNPTSTAFVKSRVAPAPAGKRK